ncbi:Sip1-like protein [Apiospora arundinis]
MGDDEPYDFATEFQAVFIPKQKPPPEPSATDMGVTLSSFPPLGQVTQLKTGNGRFTVLLEVGENEADESWEVAAWHSSDGAEWKEETMTPLKEGLASTSIQGVRTDNIRIYFTSSFSVSSNLNFTFKFRKGPAEPWRWARDEMSIGDGAVVVNPERALGTTDFADVVKELNPDLKVKSHMSQSRGTELWSIEAPVGAANGEDSTYADTRLGTPWGGFLRWVALVRIWTPWLAPRHGKTSFELDKDAIVLGFISPQGKHLVLLAVSGIDDVMTVFRHTDSGQVSFHIRNDGEAQSNGLVLAAIGDHFESALAAVVYHSRNVVLAAKKADGALDDELKALKDDVKIGVDGELNLTDEKVYKAVDTLAENKINVTSLIIDDNWQDIDYTDPSQFQRGWNSFEADPKTFP